MIPLEHPDADVIGGVGTAYPVPAGDLLAAADAAYATKRRHVPTGTVIARLDPQKDRQAWLTVRRTGIGSSDMAAVLGMSRYRSELDVWADKTGATDLDTGAASEAALWGNLLEQPVAAEWARRRGVTVRRIGTVAHVDRRHLLCDLDRLVIGCPDHDRCALEVKTRSAYKADEWKDGAIPDDVEAQVMQQLAVTGLDAVHVAALVGGQTLESRLVTPEADYIADLFTIADQFWTENVLGGVAPVISSLDLLVSHLSRLAPDKGVRVPLDTTEEREVRHLSRIAAEGARAAAAGKEAEARLKAIIGERGTDVVLDEVTWWSWRAQAKARQLDVAALEADLPAGKTVDDYKMKPTDPDGAPLTQRVLRKGPGVAALLEDDE